MKIDLHVHTRKVPNKDNQKRDITPNEFCEIMEKAKVTIVAITNHNFFDLKQYNEITKIINQKEQDLLLIPGIEIDIGINNIRKQMNILFDPKNLSYFNEFYNSFKKNFQLINNNKEKYLNWEKVYNYLKNKCSNIKIILYLDLKNLSESNNKNNTSFSKKDLESIKKQINENHNMHIICDTNEFFKYQFLISHNEDSLIGSDNSNWKDYVEKSKKLLEYNSLITDFEMLFSVFKKGESYETFDKMKLIDEIDSLEFGKNNKYKIKNIKLVKKTVNVIFGPKASGKTELLKAIYSKYKDKSILFEPSDEIRFLEKYKKEEYFKNIKKNYVEKFNSIINYKEDHITINNFYNWAARQVVFSKLTEVTLNIPSQKEITNVLKTSLEKLNEIINIFNTLKEDFDHEMKELNKFIMNLVDRYLFLKKDTFFYNINFIIKKHLINLSISFKQKTPKQTNLGLKELFLRRIKLIENISNLNKVINKNYDRSLCEFKIPTETGSKTIKLKNKLLFNFIITPKSSYSKKLTEIFNLKNKFILSSPLKLISELKEIWIEKKNDPHFIDSSNDRSFIFFHNDYEISLSKGEKYFLNLLNALNTEKEYIFLDEPETSLNNNFISTSIYRTLIEVVNFNKTIIMTTHNNILGINTKPMNYILRDNSIELDSNIFTTLIGNIQETYMKDCQLNQISEFKLRQKLLQFFEGDKEKYNYRKIIYDLEE